MKPVDLLIFDLDGTVIDSKADIATAVNKTLIHFGAEPVPLSTIAQYVGTGVRPLIEDVLKDYGVRESQKEQVLEVFSQWYLKHLADETCLFPGVEQVLKHFKAKKKVILTNKSNLFLKPLMERLRLHDHFVDAFGRESFAKRKPDPLPVLEIMKLYEAKPESTLIVGDTEVDILSGRGANIMTCGVLYGFGDPEKMAAAQPDCTVKECVEMIDLYN